MISIVPLARTIEVRTAVSAHGPWSAPRSVARCDLPRDAEAFCSDVSIHHIEAGAAIVSYAIASFAPLADARPRIARVSW